MKDFFKKVLHEGVREDLAVTDYKELYNLYEDRKDLHPEVSETAAAERDMAKVLRGLDKNLMLELDALIGKIAWAYEKQGFLFGLNYSKLHT